MPEQQTGRHACHVHVLGWICTLVCDGFGLGSRRWLGALIGLVLLFFCILRIIWAYLSSIGDPYTITMLNQFGLSIGVLSKLLQMALFLALMGSAILLDLHLIGDYGLALQQRLKGYSPEQQLLGMSRLQALLNPFTIWCPMPTLLGVSQVFQINPLLRALNIPALQKWLCIMVACGDERQRDLRMV